MSLLEVVEGELQRVDLSLEAWRAREDEDRRTGADGPLFWWATRHRVEPNKTVQLDLESLERLFVELEGREETAVRELRYLLCLLLMRKRRVSIQKVERSAEGERMIVKRPRRDQRFEVWVFDFEPERMQELRAELQAVFDGAEGPDGVRLGPDDSESGSGRVPGILRRGTSPAPRPKATCRSGPRPL